MRTTGTVIRRPLLVAVLAALAGGCATTGDLTEIRTESRVDIERFMGDWYVIANIPTFVEQNAYNSVETYRLDDDGTIGVKVWVYKGMYSDADEDQVESKAAGARARARPRRDGLQHGGLQSPGLRVRAQPRADHPAG